VSARKRFVPALRDYARGQGFVFVDPWPAMEDPGRRGWSRRSIALDVLHPMNAANT
jgi:hypothetical protein